MRSQSDLDAIQSRIQQIEAAGRVAHGALPFGFDLIGSRLPGGGLALGALYEVAGGGNGAVDGAAAALFAAAPWRVIQARSCGV